jgi:hypothetical protein
MVDHPFEMSIVDLEYRITPWRHVYEVLVFYLLEMQCVRSAARKLKLALLTHDLINIVCKLIILLQSPYM